jgi:hypothetical protein
MVKKLALKWINFIIIWNVNADIEINNSNEEWMKNEWRMNEEWMNEIIIFV